MRNAIIIAAFHLLLLFPADFLYGQTPVWERVDSFAGGNISALDISPQGNIAAGMYDIRGVVVSSDEGDHWNQLLINRPSPWLTERLTAVDDNTFILDGYYWSDGILSALSFYPSTLERDGDALLAGDFSALYESLDKGKTWNQIGFLPGLIDFEGMCFDVEGNIYVSDSDNVYRSDDRGESWDLLSAGIEGYYHRINVSPQGYLYLSSWTNGILRSTDDGGGWESIDQGLETKQVAGIVFDQADGESYAGLMSGGVYGWDEDAGNWSLLGLEDLSVRSLVINSSGQIFAGTNLGIYRSPDAGMTWEILENGMPGAPFGNILINRQNQIYADAAIAKGNVKSGDGGFTWGASELPGIHASAQIENTFYVAHDEFYVSDDGGETWTATTQNFGDPFIDVAVAPGGDLHTATESGSLYKSTDGGYTWELLLEQADVTAVGVGSNNDIHVGLEGRGLYRFAEETGELRYEGLVNRPVEDIVLSPSGSYFAMGGYGAGVMVRSEDQGETWFPLSNDLPLEAWFNSLIVSKSGDLFLGTNDGLYYSMDDGDSWIRSADGLTNKHLNALAIDRNGSIYASTNSGLYRTNMPLTVDTERPLSNVTTDQLLPHYPNPASDRIIIPFYLAKGGDVNLSMFDITGRTVNTTHSTFVTQGRYRIEWIIPRYLSSGLYLYTFETDTFRETRSIIVIQ